MPEGVSAGYQSGQPERKRSRLERKAFKIAEKARFNQEWREFVARSGPEVIRRGYENHP